MQELSDDILPELAQSKYFTVKDATSGFWHLLLDFRSSLLTTFNTQWGKYRWLRMPFGFKVSGDVFQERLDRVLRLVPGVLGIADNIVIHGATENTQWNSLSTMRDCKAKQLILGTLKRCNSSLQTVNFSGTD